MPTNMATKFSKFVYRKSCVDWLRSQNIYRKNKRPYLSLLDLKEKCTKYVGISTKETEFFDWHDYRMGQNKVEYYHTYLQYLALFVEQMQIAKIRGMRIPLNLE